MIRGILHIDLDAFFVSVEQALRPELAGKPVIVGGRPDRRGVVASASYEARAFGVRSAMPLSRAYRLCPQAIFLQGNFARYREYSEKFMAILSDFSPALEPGGLDEAYLDVEGCDIFGTPREIAMKIKQRVRNELKITASAGVAQCKVVAKIASDLEKPDGLVEVPAGKEKEFLAPLPIRRIPGVGSKTEQKLRSLNINTIGQLANLPVSAVSSLLGSYGIMLHHFANGVDNRKVEAWGEAKSISNETTFEEDISDYRYLHGVLRYLSERVGSRLREDGKQAKVVSIKIRFPDFETLNRSTKLPEATMTDADIYGAASVMLDRVLQHNKLPVRLVGVEVSSLSGESKQLGLFDYEKEKMERRDRTIDSIRKKYGFDSVQTGSILALKQIFEK